MGRQTTVTLPDDYRIKFERFNRDYELGYSSFPEFIRDCMRRRFTEIEKSK
ncbi:MAG: hypothetical protein GF411_19665 [Candidatus Lokiarchaeota archaeon]|nr:hypothetical protein [Candidatus Lokiarchaeota archaeon]